jgi:hypothetical protein
MFMAIWRLNGQTTYDIYKVNSVSKITNELLPKHRAAAFSNGSNIAQVMVHSDGDLKVYWSRVISSVEIMDSINLPISAFNADVAFYDNLNQFLVIYQGFGGIFEIEFQYNSTLGIYQYSQPTLVVQNTSTSLFGNPKVESDQFGNVALLYNTYNSSSFNSGALNYFIKGRNSFGNWSTSINVNLGLSVPTINILRGGEITIEKFNSDNRIYFGTIQGTSSASSDNLYVRSILFSELMSGISANIVNHYTLNSGTALRQVYISSGVYDFSGANYNFAFSYIKQNLGGGKRYILKLSNSTSNFDSITNLIDELNFDDLLDLNHEFTSDFLSVTGCAKKKHSCFDDFDVFYFPLQLQQQTGSLILSDFYYLFDGSVRNLGDQRSPRISSIFLNGSSGDLKLWFHDENTSEIVSGEFTSVNYCGFGKKEFLINAENGAEGNTVKSAYCVMLDGRIASRIDIRSVEECVSCNGLIVIEYVNGKTKIYRR